MKGFIQRLALLIHWIVFVGVVGGVVVGLWIGTADSLDEGTEVVWLSVVSGLIFWVLKWLISGNKSLWPWKSSE